MFFDMLHRDRRTADWSPFTLFNQPDPNPAAPAPEPKPARVGHPRRDRRKIAARRRAARTHRR